MTTLITGWVAVDHIETPFAAAEDVLGGSATAAALAAALFTDVRLLAAVGEDFPDEHRRAFEPFPIDLAGLTMVKGGKTSRWHGRYHYALNSRDTLETVLGVNDGWAPELPAGWETSEAAFLAATDPEVQQELMRRLPHDTVPPDQPSRNLLIFPDRRLKPARRCWNRANNALFQGPSRRAAASGLRLVESGSLSTRCLTANDWDDSPRK